MARHSYRIHADHTLNSHIDAAASLFAGEPQRSQNRGPGNSEAWTPASRWDKLTEFEPALIAFNPLLLFVPQHPSRPERGGALLIEPPNRKYLFIFTLCEINFQLFFFCLFFLSHPFVLIYFVNFLLVTAGNVQHNHLIFLAFSLFFPPFSF